MPYLLTIAGHDPSHGAGLTADLAAWAAMGLDGASVVTALTVQNSSGVQRVEPVAAATVREALQSVLADGEPAAVKIGLLGSAAVAREVAAFAAARRCPVVLDPVLAASNGRAAHAGDDAEFIKALGEAMRHADVITPNRLEAERLLAGRPVTLEALRRLGRSAVVLKGGHAPDEAASVDWVADGERTASLSCPRLPVSAHGTGCVYSAVLAGMMSQGWGVFEAAAEAQRRVHAGIAQARPRPGRPHLQPAPQPGSAHLPALRWGDGEGGVKAGGPFPALTGPLGFYPVVPDADWVERLLAWGVRTVQLRIKAGDLAPADLDAEIARAVQAGRRTPGAQVFINDHWESALAHGAYGVHLGQEDIETADLAALRRAGLRLGLSSHTPAEMARVQAVQPSYAAIGPVYPTTLKAMRYDPVGLVRLREWAAWYRPRYPVVAIGGISLARAPQVLACGVDSLAVVSAVTQAEQPRGVVDAFLRLFAD